MSEVSPDPQTGGPQPAKTAAGIVIACDVVGHIVEQHPEIESLRVVTYQETPNWAELPSAETQNEMAFRLKGLRQDAGERIVTTLPRKETSAENLVRLAKNAGDGRLLAAISKVTLAGGGTKHIPMMDFLSKPSPENLEVLKRLLREITGYPGFVLESGRSYHYYGATLLTDEEWRAFAGKCLLMSGHADVRYIGHQMVDGHCVLRLSAGKLRTHVPRVVAHI